MNKIALIVGTNLHWTPFYYRYENILNRLNLPFDLLMWNREGLTEKNSAKNVYEYNSLDDANNKNPLKVVKFLGFSNFVKRTLKKNNYDKIVFVGTYGGVVALCVHYLSRNFDKKMWIDIRDDLYEWFKPYYIAQKKSIEHSFATSISSPAYTKFLPNYAYLYMHNIDPNASEMVKTFQHIPDENGRIRISFIGNVRYYEQNKRLIDLLGNDKRFILQYYGNGSEILLDYCKVKGITNVDFRGVFSQEQTVYFYERTDIINNVYGNETMNLQLALSNKLYYGLCLKIPILVSDHTLMEELIEEYNIGFTFVDNASFADELYSWYQGVKLSQDNCGFDELWQKFQQEDNECIRKLEEFLTDKI